MKVGETYKLTCYNYNYDVTIISIKNNGDIYGSFSGTEGDMKVDGRGLFKLSAITRIELVVPEYKWPAGVSKGSYMAMNKDGRWFIFTCEPYLDDYTSEWQSDSTWVYVHGSCAYPISELGYENPPTPSDWKKSLIRKV